MTRIEAIRLARSVENYLHTAHREGKPLAQIPDEEWILDRCAEGVVWWLQQEIGHRETAASEAMKAKMVNLYEGADAS